MANKTPPPPVNTPDNLRSNDKMEAILALCHGPIRGLVNGDKSFLVGEVPLQANDNSYNFLNASLSIYPGYTPGETIRPMLGGYEDFRGVWQNLVPNQSLEFTTQSPTATTIILRFGVKKLWRRVATLVLDQFPGDGLAPATANFTIEYRPASSPTWINPYGTAGYSFVGKALERDVHEVRLAVTGSGPFVVRIRQTTATSTDAPCEIELEGYYDVAQGLYGLTTSQNVGVQLEQNIPVVRTTRQPPQRKDGSVGIDMIDIRLVVSQLVYQRQPAGNDPGGTFNEELLLNIEHKLQTSSTWSNHFGGPVRIYGKITGDQVVFEYRIPVTPSATRYDVRITRISGEDSERIRRVAWESMQEAVGGPARFDGIALAQFSARATNQFSSMPSLRGIYDLKIVKVPTNYNPETRTYTGTWDGTFKLAWTDNPAWCLYDLAMDDTYGARKFWPELNLDRYSVYEAAQWCDEMVPDGLGGFQPRYTMNTLITEGRGVKDQLRYMAGAFNGILVDELNGNVRLIVDKDDAAVAVFAPENVVDGQFDYAYTDIQTRYNEITVRFKNKDLNYENDARKIIDAEHQALYGVIPFEFAAVGCTDSHEALRRAAYRLITSTTEVETVSFRVNRRGLLVRPFDVILVSDPDMGRALSGRIKSLNAARTVVTLRDPLYLEGGVSYKLWLDVPDEAKAGGVRTVETALSGSYSGYVTSLTLAQALPANTPELATFSLGASGSSAGAPKAYRVMKIDNEEGDADSIAIEAVEINRNKWAYADLASEVGGIVTVQYSGEIVPPVSVTITAKSREINGETKPYVEVVWEPSRDPRVNQYRVQYRLMGDETWIDAALTRGNRVEIYEIGQASYDIRVGAVYGTEIAWYEKRAVETGSNIAPSNVATVTLNLVGEAFHIAWTAVPDTDLSHYTVRYSPSVDASASWASATVLVEKTTSTSAAVAANPGTYFVKAVDVDGLESVTARSVVAPTPTAPTGLTLTATTDASSDGVTLVLGIEARWTAPSHPYISGYELNYRKSGATTWEFVSIFGATTRWLVAPVVDGKVYEFRVRTVSGLAQSAWSSVVTLTGQKDTTPPSAPTNFTTKAMPVVVELNWTLPSDLDLAAIEIQVSTTQAGTYTFLAETKSSTYTHDLLGGTTRWYRIRSRDRANNVSAWVGPISGTAGYISTTDFVDSIKVIGMPATAAQLSVYKVADQVIVPQANMTDTATSQALVRGRLYRWSGTLWVDIVSGPQVAGTLTDSQIAEISAAKLNGQITSTQISDGAISTAKLAAGSVSTAKLAAGAVTADTIAANSITAVKIATAAIDANKIAAGAITAEKLAATELITASAQIAAAVITTAKIQDLQVTTLKVANNAITDNYGAYFGDDNGWYQNQYAWNTVNQVTVTETTTQRYQILVVNWAHNTTSYEPWGPEGSYVTITTGVTVEVQVNGQGVQYIPTQGFGQSVTYAAVISLGPGTHTFSVRSYPLGGWLKSSLINIVKVKK